MRSVRLVTIYVNKISFDRNDPILGLDISTRHSLPLKLSPSSVVIDVIIELAVINELNSEGILFNILRAELAYPLGRFGGLN